MVRADIFPGSLAVLSGTAPPPYWCPQEDSNLSLKLRKLLSYPLNDEGATPTIYHILYCNFNSRYGNISTAAIFPPPSLFFNICFKNKTRGGARFGIF